MEEKKKKGERKRGIKKGIKRKSWEKIMKIHCVLRLPRLGEN